METLTADNRIEQYVTQAHAAGLPRDQVERFIQSGYFAFPKILPFHAAARLADRDDGPDEIGLGGTRYFGKTHAVMAQVGLDDCQRVPGLKVLFLRKIQLSASESLEDLVYRVFRFIPHRYVEGEVRFPNGSRIIVGGFNNENDIDKYLGIEYDVLVVEEATQLSERKIQKIYGSIRTSIPGFRARKYLTTNPDGVGLQWFKSRFILPWRARLEKWSRFFNCHWRDNPLANPEYIRYLETLTGPLAKAWRDGDWDAFAGMAFPDWSHDRHVIQPFEIPDNWTRWRAIDYGFIHPFVAGWFAKDPATGRIILYRCISHQMLSDKMQARTIKENTPPNEKVQITYASPDMWARRAADDGRVVTPADNYAAEGVHLTRADNDRLNGKRKLHSALADLPDGKPGFQVFSTCTPFIDCIPTLVSDPNRPEDVLKVDADPATGLGGDDPYDMGRYGFTAARLAPSPLKKDTRQQRTIYDVSFL